MNPNPYDPNVPTSPDQALSDTQPLFLNNFLQLYDIFKQNHVPLDAVSGAGNHTIIQLYEQENVFQTNVGEISVYTKDAPGQTDQIYLKYQGTAGPELQFTNYQLYSLQPTTTQTSYFTFLPGRILVYFGQCSTVATLLPPNATLNLLPPIAKNIITVCVTPLGSTAAYKPSINVQQNPQGYFNAITFPLSSNTQPANCFYLVMANV